MAVYYRSRLVTFVLVAIDASADCALFDDAEQTQQASQTILIPCGAIGVMAQAPRHEPLYEVDPRAGASIEVFYAERAVETFGWQAPVGSGAVVARFCARADAYRPVCHKLRCVSARDERALTGRRHRRPLTYHVNPDFAGARGGTSYTGQVADIMYFYAKWPLDTSANTSMSCRFGLGPQNDSA